MLNQILHTIEDASGPVNLNDLSRKLGIERSALEGMIQFWVRKGCLRDDDADLAAEAAAMSNCASTSCGGSCAGMADCPFVAKMPKTYSIPTRNID